MSSRTNRMIKRQALVWMALLILVSTIISTTPTHAAGETVQLAVFSQVCNVWSSIVEATDQECLPVAATQIKRVEGYNQNDDWVVWESKNFICEIDGNNSTFIRGWWWQFQRDEGVKIHLLNKDMHGNEMEFTIKRDIPIGKPWLLVIVRDIRWNDITIRYDYISRPMPNFD